MLISCYFVAQIQIHDENEYKKYLDKVDEVFKNFKGKYLVVGVNSDESVRRLNKASNRPVNDQESRALIIASLQVVDLVVIFDNDTPKELIQFMEPSILVKGADYDASITDEKDQKYIVGANEVIAYGGKVMTIELEEGFSTTGIINRLK